MVNYSNEARFGSPTTSVATIWRWELWLLECKNENYLSRMICASMLKNLEMWVVLMDVRKQRLKAHRNKDAIALSMIQQWVADIIFPRIINIETRAKDACNILQNEYRGYLSNLRIRAPCLYLLMVCHVTYIWLGFRTRRIYCRVINKFCCW